MDGRSTHAISIAAVAFLLLGCEASQLPGFDDVHERAYVAPRFVPPKPATVHRPDGPAWSYRLVVKFVDDARVRIDDGGLWSDTDANLGAIDELAARERLQFRPLVAWAPERLRALEARAEARSGRAQPDFAGIYIVDVPSGDLERVGNALQPLAIVERAWIETLRVPPPADLVPPTPDLVDQQTYLPPDPGFDTLAAWNMGLHGQGLRLGDVEFAWSASHEELADISLHPEPGQTPAALGPEYIDHGTAVLGITSAPDNGFGITGIVSNAAVHTHTEESVEEGPRRAAAMLSAFESSEPGDVVMLEIQTGSFAGIEFAPGEYEYGTWLATRMGADAGVVIVAAAGNGGLDLDGDPFMEYRSWGDSGAIIVGAANSNTLSTLGFSNFGTRVDLLGWGENVFTLAYGDFASYGFDPRQSYTSDFGGTSSATPLVASAAVQVQQLAIQVGNGPLTSEQMRTLLVDTGLDVGSGEIGPMPSVRSAAKTLLPEEAVPPTLTITAPADGTHVDANSWEVDVEIEAVDDSLLVEQVQLRIGGQLIDVTDDSRPLGFTGVVFPKGAWEIVAQGRDLWGNLGESEPITIYVDPPGVGSTGVVDDSGSGGAAGSSSTGDAPGTSSSEGTSEGGEAPTTTGAPATGGDGDGCGCAQSGGSMPAWLVVVLGWRRARRIITASRKSSPRSRGGTHVRLRLGGR